jgi:hypothetical protein
MANNTRMFEAISLLRQQLFPGNLLNVRHGAYSWTAKFTWFPPASKEKVEAIEAQLTKPLPLDYRTFLVNVSDGAVIFEDADHGQWGFRMYGTGDIVRQQHLWQTSLSGKWNAQSLAFAECLGEAHVMVFDLARPMRDASSFAVKEGSPIDAINDWPIASRSFHEWLEHLVTAQGDKYWAWK